MSTAPYGVSVKRGKVVNTFLRLFFLYVFMFNYPNANKREKRSNNGK
nr:MAG TPA: hypothetical protein [Caudoviricetes sp.]